MIRFTVHPDIFMAFPGLVVVGVVADGIDNQTENAATTRHWRDAWGRAGAAATAHGNAQSHPHVVPWRERMRSAGVSPKQFSSSIEALLRRAIRGGEPFAISPLVDGYSAVSLDHVVPAGGFDLDDLAGLGDDLALRPTVPGDTFVALGDDQPVEVPSGELGYAAGATVLTRHVVRRQSRQAAITHETRSVVLLSEILAEIEATTPGTTRRVSEALTALTRDAFGRDATPFRIDAAAPSVVLRP